MKNGRASANRMRLAIPEDFGGGGRYPRKKGPWFWKNTCASEAGAD